MTPGALGQEKLGLAATSEAGEIAEGNSLEGSTDFFGSVFATGAI
jgi:hypothetical protein